MVVNKCGAIGKVGGLRVLKSKRQSSDGEPFVDLRPFVGDNAFEAGIKTAAEQTGQIMCYINRTQVNAARLLS